MKLFRWSRESDAGKEVWKHMMAGEKLKLYIYGAVYGAWYGLTLALPFGLLAVSLLRSSETLWPQAFDQPDIALEPGLFLLWFLVGMGWPTALGIVLVGVAINIPLAIYVQRKFNEICASSQWATVRGYTVDDL